MSEADRQARRRAIELAFNDHLKADELAAALKLYDAEFAHVDFFLSRNFITRLGQLINVAAVQAKLFVSLHKTLFETGKGAMRAPASSIGGSPPPPELRSIGGGFELTGTAAPTPAAAPRHAPVAAVPLVQPSPARPAARQTAGPELTVFNALMERLLSRFTQHDPATLNALIRHLLAAIARMRVTEAESRDLREWVQDPLSRRLMTPIGESAMQACVHESYVWACDELGPVKSDRIFAGSVREVEQMSEALVFSPRRLC
jgi:hypothetical protein